MASNEVARSKSRAHRAPLALVAPPPSKTAEAVDDLDEHIAEIRKQLAELHWYGDQTIAGRSGVEPEFARVKMAEAACQIGMLLNIVEHAVAVAGQAEEAEATE